VKRYLIIIEPTATGFSAYVPDVPGCVSTGHTREQVRANLREALAFHLDGLKMEGLPVQQPNARAAYLQIDR
jgi:predicted RNase H-like HicB family nuclease